MKLVTPTSQPQSRASRLYSSGEKLVERTVEEFQSKSHALSQLKKARLSLPKRLADDEGEPITPKLPRDLSALTSERLGLLMTQFAAHADYVAVAAAEADIELSVAEHIYEHVQAVIRLEKEGTVQERADKTHADPQVKAAAQNYYNALALAKMTQTLLHAAERDLNVVSREVTRRTNEMGRTR